MVSFNTAWMLSLLSSLDDTLIACLSRSLANETNISERAGSLIRVGTSLFSIHSPSLLEVLRTPGCIYAQIKGLQPYLAQVPHLHPLQPLLSHLLFQLQLYPSHFFQVRL